MVRFIGTTFTHKGVDLGWDLARAAFALALGQAEDVFKAASWGVASPQLRHLTGLLEATGYALTQVEIDRVTPRDDGDDAAAAGEDDQDENDVARCPVCGGRGERHRRSMLDAFHPASTRGQ